MTDLSMSGVFTGKKIGSPPCTPQACMEILDHYGIDCTGKGSCYRQKPCCRKTGGNDAGKEKRNRNHLPHQNGGYAVRCKRS